MSTLQTVDGIPCRPQQVTPKSDEQKARCANIVASFRKVLNQRSQPKQELIQNPVRSEKNQNRIELFRKYQESNYGERHA
ncbi:hypothetical protein ACMAZF_01250 [Psychrobium sp. nBUS_13]|uniref:hypothetical protein n=1 Tax=Psychrobium sp. nBUS_13 TaxID=3395319 RepID=UPI003EBDB35F